MLRGTCPDCGLHADLSVFLGGADASRGHAAALQLPAPLAGRVLQYLRLFRPAGKALSHRKAARLLTELAAAVRQGQIARRGQTWPAPLPLWEAALDTLLDKPPERLPLRSHGYLFEVAAGLAATQLGAAERQREAQARPRPALSTPAINLEISNMINDLHALRRLEAHNPGTHTAALARLEAALDAHQPPGDHNA